jgi:triosephosphate isomerase
MARTKLVVGNWKMHGLGSDIAEIRAIAAAAARFPSVETGLCVPSTLVDRAARAVPGFAIGAQDVHFAERVAHTCCTSAPMLVDAGAKLVIVGHSERRDAQREADEEIARKAAAAIHAGLSTILCVGESLDVREAGEAVSTVERQLDRSLPKDCDVSSLAIAYEPIWAIGTGKIPTIAEIAEMHAALRRRLVDGLGGSGNGIRILYGGSVKASNAAEIFSVADVDGALVGGASLDVDSFASICRSASR